MMRALFIALIIGISSLASAQDMMQKALEMQRCMEGVDQQELKRIGEKSLQFEKEVKALCNSGSSAKAQKKLLAFGQEMKNSKALEKIQECSKIMAGMIPDIPYADKIKEYEGINICESF